MLGTLSKSNRQYVQSDHILYTIGGWYFNDLLSDGQLSEGLDGSLLDS